MLKQLEPSNIVLFQNIKLIVQSLQKQFTNFKKILKNHSKIQFDILNKNILLFQILWENISIKLDLQYYKYIIAKSMSFLVKGVLKKLLKQYLNIVDDIIMEKGYIQLPCGHLNHESINNNENLINKGIQIASSQYQGLAISIPIMQIQSKPIIFKAESLKVVILIDDRKAKEGNKNNKSKQSSKSNKKQSSTIKTPQKKQNIKQGNDSYIKGLANRLLANMELQLKSLQIIILHKDIFLNTHSYRLSIHNLLIKNSLSLLEANLLKKIVCLGSISLQRLKLAQEIKIQSDDFDKLLSSQQIMANIVDLNMSLNIDYKKINAIILLDCIKIKIQTKAALQFIQKVSLMTKMKQDSKQQQNQVLNKQKQEIIKTDQKSEQKLQAGEENLGIADPRAAISLDSLQVKINQIQIALIEKKSNNTFEQLYCIHTNNLQIAKQYLPRNIQKRFQITIQSENIAIRDISTQIFQLSVNKLNEENIQKRSQLKLNNEGVSSSKNLEDYDKVIKNKKKQFMIKIQTNKLRKPIITLDTFAIILNLSHSFIRDITYLLEILNPIIRYIPKNFSSRAKHGKYEKNQFQEENQNREIIIEDDKNQKNKYDLEINVLNTSIDLSIAYKKQKPLSLCLFTEQILSIKITKKQIHVNLNEKIIVYLNILRVCCIKELNIAIIKSQQRNKKIQVIVSVRGIMVQLDFKEIFNSINRIKQICKDQVIFHLQNNIEKIIKYFVEKQQDIVMAEQPIEKQIYHKNKQVVMYLQINRFQITIGQLNKSKNYFPIFIVELNDIKSSKAQESKKLSFLFSSLSCISPHNLTNSVICTGTNFAIQSSKNLDLNKGNIRIKIEQKFTHSLKITVKDPVNIELQQEHICILLNIINSMKVQEQNIFISAINQTNAQIILLTLDEEKIKLKKQPLELSLKSQKSNKQKADKTLIFEDDNIFKLEIPTEFIVQPGDKSQVFLQNLVFRVRINNQVSEPINIKKLQHSHEKLEIYELPIVFNYQQQCSYVLQIKTSTPLLQLTFKYKYQLYIFPGIQDGLNHIHKLKLKCDFPERQLCYQKFSEMKDNGEPVINHKICFGWQLLEDSKIDLLSFQIATTLPSHPKILKASKLISNNIHYKLYGLYSPEALSEQDKALIGPNSQLNPKYNYFYYYILEEVNIAKSSIDIINSDSLSHKYHLMPFLIFRNNLIDTSLKIKVSNKKVENTEQYQLAQRSSLVAFKGASDYYMKQYMIRIQINQQMQSQRTSKKKQKKNEINQSKNVSNCLFESQQHYFNTFFMVNESFESAIELRSAENKKRYLRVRQSFIKKTKIVQIQNSLILLNQSEIPLKINFVPSFYASIKKDEKQSQEKSLVLPKKKEITSSRRIKKNDKIIISYCFEDTENMIQVPMSDLQEAQNKIVLSYNFCRLSKDSLQQRQDNEDYFHVLLKMEFKQNNNAQFLTFTPYLTFSNLCKPQKMLRINNHILRSRNSQNRQPYQSSMSLYLPSNTNKDYNNKWVPANAEKIYEDLFVSYDSWIIQGNSDLMQIEILNNEGNNLHPKAEDSIKFYDLLSHKIIEHKKSVYSLVKSMKDESIQFYFSDQLFNTSLQNTRYFIFNNQTSKSFLMSSGDQEYAKYLLFPKNSENQIIGNREQSSLIHSEKYVNKQQKIYIPGKGISENKQALNILLNKDRYDIFLCDKHQQKLESFNSKKLQKLGIKQQKYIIDNFVVLNLEQQLSAVKNKQASKLHLEKSSREFQVITNNLNFKIVSRKKKIGAFFDYKKLNFRVLEASKVDILIKDISASVILASSNSLGSQEFSTNSTVHQILRIPEESYFLIEGKIFDSKFILLKNLFIKCKMIDLHINKPLLTFLVNIQKFAKQTLDSNKQNESKSLRVEGTHFNYTKNTRILGLVTEKLILMRSLNLHQINLCLNVQTTSSVDFSNIIALPELSMSNKCYKFSNFSKDISNHYLTNIIAKFPKISFIYQNLKSPISMIKSLIQARQVILDKQQDEQKKKYFWSRSFVSFENTYDSNYLLKNPNLSSKQGKQNGGIFYNYKKLDLHNELISQFLSKQYCQELNGKEKVLCSLKNIIFSNISKQLPISTGSQPQYILTNKNIYIIVQLPLYSPSSGMVPIVDSPEKNKIAQLHLMQQKISLKEIQSIKIWRYNPKSGELVINFKKKGNILKIVDKLQACQHILQFIRSSIV